MSICGHEAELAFKGNIHKCDNIYDFLKENLTKKILEYVSDASNIEISIEAGFEEYCDDKNEQLKPLLNKFNNAKELHNIFNIIAQFDTNL